MDEQAAIAPGALRKTGQEVLGLGAIRRPAPGASRVSADVILAGTIEPHVRSLPEVIGNDTQVGAWLTHPL